jgi:hypothetical protein
LIQDDWTLTVGLENGYHLRGRKSTVRTLNPLLALCVTLLVTSRPQLEAQKSSCDVPLVVTRFVAASRTVELVRDLTAKDLAIKVGGSPSTVKSASVDTGRKRVALILDASKKVPTDEWKLETEMAVSLIENARPLDRFTLLLVGVDTSAGTLLPPEDLQAELRGIASSRPTTVDENERIYDTLLAAAKRFDPPEFGDAIFLFGHPNDLGSKATAEQVEELILKNRLRFYAVSFTDALPKDIGQEQADKISHATGYFFSFHSVDVLKIRGQRALLEGFLADLYAGIAQPYQLKISLNTSDKTALDLAVVNGKDRNIRQDDVHYPHFIYPCTSR